MCVCMYVQARSQGGGGVRRVRTHHPTGPSYVCMYVCMTIIMPDGYILI